MTMLKLVSPQSFGFTGKTATVIPWSQRGLVGADRAAMEKLAGYEFVHRIRDLPVAPGETLIHLISHGATERYGCFVAGTPIAMADGTYRPVQDIVVGDDVLSADGNTCDVAHLFVREVSSTVVLDVCGLANELQSSPDHPYRVARHEQFQCDHDKYKRCLPPTFGQQNICNRPITKTRECVTAGYRQIAWEWSTAADVREGDFLIWTAPKDLSAPIEITAAEGYILGAWLAEGCFQRNTSNNVVASLRLSMHVKETAFLAEIQTYGRALGWTVSDYVYPGEKRENERIVCIRNDPSRFRIWQALFGELVDGKHLPPWVCCLPRAVRLAIVAGYLDGDGSCVVDNKENRTTARSHGRELSLGMQRLCWSLGFPAVVCPVHGTDNESNLSIANSYLSDLEAYSWKVRGRELKQTTKVHGFFHDGRMYMPVRECRQAGPATVYNFEVAGDHTYSGPNVDSHNCNRNGDGFKRATCDRYHPTFVSHARFFRDHDNKKPEISYGLVKMSHFNPIMDRVELIVALNGTKAAASRNGGLVADKEHEKLAKNEPIPVSMACSIPFDVCSYCGNKARNRNEYCRSIDDGGHCKAGGLFRNIGALVEVDGAAHHLHADNPDPTWRDISHVDKPADRIAYALGAFRKSANVTRELCGAELAEALGLQLPAAYQACREVDENLLKIAQQLAQYESELSRQPTNVAGLSSFAKVADAANVSHDYLTALADAGAWLPLPQFLELTTSVPHDKLANITAAVRSALPGVFTRLIDSDLATDHLASAAELFTQRTNKDTVKAAASQLSQWAVDDVSVRRRAALLALQSDSALPTFHKAASVIASAEAEALAAVYAGYQLHVLSRFQTDPEKLALTGRRLVMQNHTW